MMVRTSFYTFIEDLEYDEKGKIFTMMFLYSIPENQRTEEQQSELEELLGDRFMKSVFNPFRKILDEDNEKYERTIVARNRENGKKGGRPRKNPVVTEEPNKEQETHSVFENPENPQPLSTTTPTTTPIEESTFSSMPNTMVFSPPTLEEVLEYAKWIMVTPEVAEKFFWYYSKFNWEINERPIKNWRAALSSWKNNSYKYDTANNTGTGFHATRREELANIALEAAKKSARKAK